MLSNGILVLVLSVLGGALPAVGRPRGAVSRGLHVEASSLAGTAFLMRVLGAMIAPREGRYLQAVPVHEPSGRILMRVIARAHRAESANFLYLRILAQAGVTTVIRLDLPRKPFPSVRGAIAGGRLVRQDLPVPNYVSALEGAYGQFLIRSGAETQLDDVYAVVDEDEIHVAADQDARSITFVTAHEIVHAALWVLRLPSGHREPGVDTATCQAERQAAEYYDRSPLAGKLTQGLGLSSTRECQNELGTTAFPVRSGNFAAVRTGDTASNIQAETVAGGDRGNPDCDPFLVDPPPVILGYTRPLVGDPNQECLDSRRQIELHSLATWSNLDGVIEQHIEALVDLTGIRGNAARVVLEGMMEVDALAHSKRTLRQETVFARLPQRHRLPRRGQCLPTQAVFHRGYHVPNLR